MKTRLLGHATRGQVAEAPPKIAGKLTPAQLAVKQATAAMYAKPAKVGER